MNVKYLGLGIKVTLLFYCDVPFDLFCVMQIVHKMAPVCPPSTLNQSRLLPSTGCCCSQTCDSVTNQDMAVIPKALVIQKLNPTPPTPPIDDEPGPGPTPRPYPEHRGPASSPRFLPSRPGSADAQGHLHGHHELPQRVPAHPPPAAGGPPERLPGRSVLFVNLPHNCWSILTLQSRRNGNARLANLVLEVSCSVC